MKFNKKNSFYIILFAVVFAVCAWACISAAVITRSFKRDVAENKLSNRKVMVEDLLLTETKNGEKYWEIYADKGFYEDDKNVATIYDSIGNFYDKNEVVASFQSPKATVNSETQDIILYNRSKLIYKDRTSIQADEFTYTGNNEPIYAKGNVVIERPNEYKIIAKEAVLSGDMTEIRAKGNTVTKVYEKGDKK